MGDVDMLGKATAVIEGWAGIQGTGAEQLAREVLRAAGVLGASAQPPPLHFDGEPSMHDVVTEWVRARTLAHPGTVGAATLLAQVLAERKAFGLAKYGTELQISGPRDPFVDVSDELVDALVYAQQGLERSLIDGASVGVVAWWAARRDEIGHTLIMIMDVRSRRGD